VLPWAWSATNGGMSMQDKMSFELITGQHSSFFQPVDSFSDFKTNMTFWIETVIGEFMFVNDFLRNTPAVTTHVLEDFHFRDEKEILEISSAAACSMLGIQDGAIEL
jgi:hypothetical protein